ncbi:MAG: hypothetical protein LM550_17300 [Candidatus Contendobacter sp.]|nr:hypothetical protein [Candidatus Contendobacter sp.]
MLVMGRDHTLYYEAYNDASDLNGDGVIDVGYKPDKVLYYGYFDSYKCYQYNESDKRFNPVAMTGEQRDLRVKNNNKKCSGQWSGDFLNYVTTSRIDALRKVLYGGRRVVDNDADLTVLERSYIPQDAHSWGKEYKSVARDGYDVSQYTPLALPVLGKQHLFANTTLSSGDKEPLVRVLNDSKFRIWEWVARERPVAGSKCASSDCETSAKTETGGHPKSGVEFEAIVSDWATAQQQCGSNSIAGGVINTKGSNNNPFIGASYNDCTHENYLTLIKGQINALVEGEYEFATNGDDAVEVLIDRYVVANWYGGHGACNKSDISSQIDCIKNSTDGQPPVIGTVFLTQGLHALEFRHEEVSSGDSYQLLWKQPGGSWEVVPATALRNEIGTAGSSPLITTYNFKREIPASKITDYSVRVKVCDSAVGLEPNCKQYPGLKTPLEPTYKPIGLLHDYGETDRMLFGLISGSYGKNDTSGTNKKKSTQGGVLRKNIESFKNEVNPNTGQFSSLVGIVRTIDQFQIVDYDGSSYSGGWEVEKPLSESSKYFPDWGNPIGEMMYESLRYFSGKKVPTPAFMPTLTAGKEEEVEKRIYVGEQFLKLPAPDWKDPYTTDANGIIKERPWCTASAQLVISDVNPSYDTDQMPGSFFNSFSGDISGLNATAQANAIWAAEHGGSSQHFIGQSDTLYDGAPSAKTVTGLGNIRGLAPAEPTKQGGYYSSAIARYAYKNDIRADLKGDQKIQNFSVALSSPLPRLEIPVGKKWITLVPFGKTVATSGSDVKTRVKGKFQPTNSIVDFFVEKFVNTDPNGSDKDETVAGNEGRPFLRFRINFEDVEQGADHDMDAIVLYDLRVNAEGELVVTLTEEYESAGYTMNYGYVISGTTQDGIYLEVSWDAGNSAYFLNTPNGLLPGVCDVGVPLPACSNLPLVAAPRVFTPSGNANATLLKDPLWYAAKYGSDGNDKLAKGETSPNYFLVTNASTLQSQLDKAFKAILGITTSASAVATNATKLGSESLLYQAKFRSDEWTGELLASPGMATVTTAGQAACPDGQVKAICWDAGALIQTPSSRAIWTLNPDPSAAPAQRGVPFLWDNLDAAQKVALGLNPVDPATADIEGQYRLAWLRGDLTEKKSWTNPATSTAFEFTFRKRSRALGDIVNFNPVLVKADYFAYELLPDGTPGKTTYLDFYAANKSSRSSVVYVGANDGMLHAFDGTTGVEKFAYIPGVLVPGLAELTRPNYGHRYYVNGQAFAGDAYWGSSWKTVLVSSLGAGARGIFALDITDPSSSFDAGKVLWEFTSAHDSDLGYVIEAPAIGRMADGQWAAVFGNGYNSASQQAFLFIVNLETGALIKKIPTGAVDVLDNTGAFDSNGLAPPTLVLDATSTITTAYAGDLRGNLWKFDLSATAPGTSTAETTLDYIPKSPPAAVASVASGSKINHWSCSGWCSAFSASNSFNPLFTAVSQDGEPQPITSKPAVIKHPEGGSIVLFGTGRYFAASDNVIDKVSEPVQSLYEVWDNNAPVTINKSTRGSVLQEQTILAEVNSGDLKGRVLSNTKMDWTSKKGCFIDLWSPVAKAKDPVEREGERVVLRPIIRGGRVIFTSLIPSEDPCVFGGDGWEMEIDNLCEGRYAKPLFDLNNDAVFDESDLVEVVIDGETVAVPISGVKIAGIPSLPTIIRTDQGVEIRLISTTSTGGTPPNDAAIAAAAAARAAAAAAADAAAAAAAAAQTAANEAAAAARAGDIDAAKAAANEAANAADAAADAAKAAADAAADVATYDPAAVKPAEAAAALADQAAAAAAAATSAASAASSATDPAEVAKAAAEAATKAQAAIDLARTVADIVGGLGNPRVITRPTSGPTVPIGTPISDKVHWRQIK